MTTKTDPFVTTENPLGAVTGFWTAASANGLKDVNPGAKASTTATQDCSSMWALANYTFLPDHTSEITFGTIGNGDWGGAAVRLSTTGGGQGYIAYYRPEASLVSLYKFTAGTVGSSGTFILNISGITLVSGDKLKLGVVGTTLTVYKNGTSIGTVTDATYATGQPGAAYSFQNNNVTVITAWTGTDAAAAGTALASAATVTSAVTAALSTQARLSASAAAGASVSATFTNFSSVVLTAPLMGGLGTINDPNFWLDAAPVVGNTIWFDPIITVAANGVISSASNTCQAVVQFNSG